MTIVAAIATEDRVIMGCDTAGELDGWKVYQDTKILRRRIRHEDIVLIGAAGNGAIRGVIARSSLDLGDGPVGPGSDADSWAQGIAEQITQILADTNPPLTISSSDSAGYFDGVLLLAWRNRLWIITTHTAIAPADNIAAIGCGAPIALGSLHTATQFGATPDTAMDTAVRLAARYDSGCAIDSRGPIIYTTKE